MLVAEADRPESVEVVGSEGGVHVAGPGVPPGAVFVHGGCPRPFVVEPRCIRRAATSVGYFFCSPPENAPAGDPHSSDLLYYAAFLRAFPGRGASAFINPTI